MRKLILLVDDDADDRELFGEALQEVDEAAQCLFAENGYYALEMLRKPGAILPDFIFLDLNMPMMGGKECLMHLKATPAIKEIPVIIFSTSRLQEDVDDTAQLGAAQFFTKPNVFTMLIKTIRQVVTQEWKLAEAH